jgi:endonuclease G
MVVYLSLFPPCEGVTGIDMKKVVIHFFVAMALLPIGAVAHPGTTAADGCHYCRTNCSQWGVPAGERHCHGADGSKNLTISSQILRLDYEGFTVWVDCARRGAVKFRYNAQHDTGSHPRSSRFYLDPDVPARCQQTSAASYRRSQGEKPTYDRGHLVPANHLDYSKSAIQQTNTMTNILPQVSQMNRGAWLFTEEVVECYRDIDELLVIGGVIWGDHPQDDFFVDTHGVQTPDAFWKVIIREDRVIAWLIPNTQEATRKRVDEYLIDLETLEDLTGERFSVPEDLKTEKPTSSWVLPIGCDRG